MLERIVKKYRTEGISGVGRAAVRKLFHSEPSVHPVSVALNEITSESGFTIVQIGAHVGNTGNDPLYRTLTKKLKDTAGTLILIEPVESFFNELEDNYANTPGVVFENVAISDRSGESTFFRLGVDPVAHGYPGWLSQLGSLKKERMESLWDNYEANEEYKKFYLEHRISETVKTMTLSDLMMRHDISKIDLLQIDVEGYELEILKTIDFEKSDVRFINYESVLLQTHKLEAERLMKGSGYKTVDYSQDTFCYRDSDAHLAKHWR